MDHDSVIIKLTEDVKALQRDVQELKLLYLYEKQKNDVLFAGMTTPQPVPIPDTKVTTDTNYNFAQESLGEFCSYKTANEYFHLSDSNVLQKVFEKENSSVVKDIALYVNKFQSRKYNGFIKSFKQMRFSIIKCTTIDNYVKILQQVVTSLTECFSDKKYNKNKIKSCLKKILSPLEQRLIGYDSYFESYIEPDEINLIKTFCFSNTPCIEPFVTNELCKKLSNYSLVVLPVKDVLKRIIMDKNIVYLDLPSEKSYSFYTLQKVSGDKYYWTMDCGLESVSQTIQENLLNYTIYMFRKIYSDVFNDNDYRSDYMNSCQITSCDCEQLLHNIFCLYDLKKTQNILKSHVMDFCSFNPSEKDFFNVFRDDILNKPRSLSTNLYSNIIGVLFDNIEEQDIINLTKRYN